MDKKKKETVEICGGLTAEMPEDVRKAIEEKSKKA